LKLFPNIFKYWNDTTNNSKYGNDSWKIGGKSYTHSFTVKNGPGWIRHLFRVIALLSWIQSFVHATSPSFQFWIFVQSLSKVSILYSVGHDIVFVRVNCRDDCCGSAWCAVNCEYICFVSISRVCCSNTRNLRCRGEEYEKSGTRSNVSTRYY
jgi:hypothetical protein